MGEPTKQLEVLNDKHKQKSASQPFIYEHLSYVLVLFVLTHLPFPGRNYTACDTEAETDSGLNNPKVQQIIEW